MLIGVSTHDSAGIERAAADGADYATFSPIFVSASKLDYGPALGLARLAEASRVTKLPLLALGGIDERNLASAIAADASGVAVMGEAMRADDPSRAVAALIARLRDALAAREAPGHSPENAAQKGMPP
jgi:thiamine-phosphate pyrophosphorylase